MAPAAPAAPSAAPSGGARPDDISFGAADATLALIALSVAIMLGRPVLFRQQRVGRDGRLFEVLKFRTMRPDRRATRLDVIHARRATRVGELSLAALQGGELSIPEGTDDDGAA